MGLLSLAQFMICFRRLEQPKAELFLNPFNRATSRWGIDTPMRLAHFCGQLSVESGDLRWWKELGEGVGRKYDIVTNPHLAEALGNLQPGDGERYAGRGPIQLTGRANYHAAGIAIGYPLETQPELLEQPDPGLQAAAWFWTSRGCNAYADRDDCEAITRKINGGLTAYPQRLGAVLRCKGALHVPPMPPAPGGSP